MNNLEGLIEKFVPLQETIGVDFKNKELLITAFIHRSFLNENDWVKLPHNERLEFLGDAVLELSVTEYLYKNYPEHNEGILTAWRAALVNSTMLSKKSSELGYEDYLLLSKGEKKDTGKSRQFILANAFEAVVGAMFLDRGFETCHEFIIRTLIKPELESIIAMGAFLDAKSHFQERAQEIVKTTPLYKVVEEWGPDHDKHFKIAVMLGDEQVAIGEGSSKKEAEEQAAREAFRVKGWK